MKKKRYIKLVYYYYSAFGVDFMVKITIYTRMVKHTDSHAGGRGFDPRFRASTENTLPVHPAVKWVPVGQLSCCDTGIIILATICKAL